MKTARLRWFLGALLGACLCLVAVNERAAWAQEEAPPASDAALFAEGQKALAAGRVREAIDTYEILADHGFVHPDASYNRGMAYVARVRAHEEKPGDLGRAAAAFEECLVRRPGDAEAERALEAVRNEVAKRLPVTPDGKGPLIDQGVGPRDAIAGLLPERVWSILALVSSLVLSLALFARLRFEAARPRLIASALAILGLSVLLVAGPFAFVRRLLRRTTASAVVVTKEAHWLSEAGTALTDPPVPEAAKVEILEQQGVLVRARWGKTEGLLRPTDLRVVRAMDNGDTSGSH
jgi:tetratricopeptide (TPR) repeat protein